MAKEKPATNIGAKPTQAAVEAKAPTTSQKADALKAKLRPQVREIIQTLSAEIEAHPEREGIATALDQMLGSLNKIVDRITA